MLLPKRLIADLKDRILTRLIMSKIDLWILATRADMNRQNGFFPWALVLILAVEFASIVYLGGIR
jgi:hypothetical protein